jgi:hypothetical protein
MLRTNQSLFTVNQQLWRSILIYDHGEKNSSHCQTTCTFVYNQLDISIELKAFSRLTFDLGSLLCFQQIRYLFKSKFSLSIYVEI